MDKIKKCLWKINKYMNIYQSRPTYIKLPNKTYLRIRNDLRLDDTNVEAVTCALLKYGQQMQQRK